MPSARRALLRVDAFRLALYAGLVVSALHVLDVLFAQQGSQLPVISRIEHAAQDYVLTTLRGPRAPSGRVVVVAVDERSVEAEGMWPWSRATMARLVDALAEGGVAAVGFDVVWSDQDQQGRRLAEVAGLVKAARAEASDPAQARRLDQAWAAAGGGQPGLPPDVDPTRQLADAIERARNVTVGFMFSADPPASAQAAEARAGALRFFRAEAVEVLDAGGRLSGEAAAAGGPAGRQRAVGRTFPDVVPPVAEVVEVADSGGYCTVLPDADGVIRRYHALASSGGATYPALGVAVLARVSGRDGLPAPVRPVGVAGSQVLVGLRVGALEIATDDYGRAPLNYYGPFRDFPAWSATDVLHGRIPREQMAGRIAVVGTTAPGTWDQRVTPFDPIAPGVITHATFLDNVLHGQLLERSQWVVMGEVLFMVLASVGLALLFSRVSSLAALPALAAVMALWAAVSVLALRRYNLVLASGLPLLQVFAMFLAATSYRVFSEERERRKARERFSRFLAPAIVDEVLKSEGSLKLGGEKRELTALFADIRGFTSISEQLDPHVLLGVLNQYLTPMTDIIVSGHQGTLDKYMGDAIMAFWGAPRAQPDHALRACRAALAMLEELERLRAGWRAQGVPDIDIGIGLNTGPMSVGFVGSQDRFYNYTILGDAVNLASRLEGANKEYGTRILVGPDTWAQVQGEVVGRPLDLVRVKGKRAPVRIHEILCLAPAPAALAPFLEAFAWGLSAWQAQRWDEASAHFSEADRLRGGDACARVYVARCEAMRRAPPGPEWDGVFEMKSK
ncbi:MAG: adenylate/guanylate cyclase domain-containing protein [Anaeromyxobacter sp.]|nr:adenylate/guanylate cyclase domain-containing protein [Anaeromyxobacter sp.]MBL0276066.1 adenylate/guanylate cyclase domain-containing protein [Anaeromyxobacter sp.]